MLVSATHQHESAIGVCVCVCVCVCLPSFLNLPPASLLILLLCLSQSPGLSSLSQTPNSTPIFLPGESHGQKSLVGYSTRGLKESDTTEQLTLFHINVFKFVVTLFLSSYFGFSTYHSHTLLFPRASFPVFP